MLAGIMSSLGKVNNHALKEEERGRLGDSVCFARLWLVDLNVD